MALSSNAPPMSLGAASITTAGILKGGLSSGVGTPKKKSPVSVVEPQVQPGVEHWPTDRLVGNNREVSNSSSSSASSQKGSKENGASTLLETEAVCKAAVCATRSGDSPKPTEDGPVFNILEFVFKSIELRSPPF